MKKTLFHTIALISITICFSSCRTATPNYDYQALARSSIKLGLDITQEDNHNLYNYAANWIGVPYRTGGSTKSGTDCSGFTSQLYKAVYKIELPRNSKAQLDICKKVSKNQLREGDLVFFSTDSSKKTINHVGIYLKDNKFVHASSSQGVVINSLNEPYYLTNWISGGRIR